MSKIFNVMFSKRNGGIEQSFIDYTKALRERFEVISVVNSKCLVKDQILGCFEEVRQINKYDPFAVLRIRRLIKKHKPRLIIAHSTRAYVLCRFATNSVPIVAVSHNYKFTHIIKSKYTIAITKDMKKKLENAGAKKVYLMPNMIEVNDDFKYEDYESKPVRTIGFIGSLTYFKGCDLLIASIAELEKRGILLNLKIAGDGEELQSLKKLTVDLKIDKRVEFLGWVSGESKKEFFSSIDLLCIPSRSEPFGIVFLEAMKYLKPIVSTKTIGALEVVKDIAMLVEIDDLEMLTNAIFTIYSDIKKYEVNVIKGAEEVNKYSIMSGSDKLENIVEDVINASAS